MQDNGLEGPKTSVSKLPCSSTAQLTQVSSQLPGAARLVVCEMERLQRGF